MADQKESMGMRRIKLVINLNSLVKTKLSTVAKSLESTVDQPDQKRSPNLGYPLPLSPLLKNLSKTVI